MILKQRGKMTSKEFIQEWQECEFGQYLQENFGLTLDEYEQIKWELEMIQWDEEYKYWAYDYFINYLKSGHYAALVLNERFKIDSFNFNEILKKGDILEALEEFWYNIFS